MSQTSNISYSHPHFILGSKGKISLKTVMKTMQISKINQNSSTDCNSISRTSQKKSIKSLLNLPSLKQPSLPTSLNLKYQDIQYFDPIQKKLFPHLLCFQKPSPRIEGCHCQPKCLWINYWLSISQGMVMNLESFPISPENQNQIHKDILRTQPECMEFKKVSNQSALYDCLIDYAKIDPEIGYIQGMNIICSIFIYHCSTYDQVSQIFKYFMIGCKFRQLLIHDFSLCKKISLQILFCLKYRCHDIFIMLEKYQIQLQTFIIGWLIPLLGNIIPISSMHLILNIFIQKSWQGIIKIIISMLLYLRVDIIASRDESELMNLLSTINLRNKDIRWEEVIKSAGNIRNLPVLYK